MNLYYEIIGNLFFEKVDREKILNQTIKNPTTNKDIKISTALTYKQRDKRTYDTAIKYLKKQGLDDEDIEELTGDIQEPTQDEKPKESEVVQQAIDEFDSLADDIISGKKSPPGTGGSAIGELYGGVAINEVYGDDTLTEDDFVESKKEEVLASPMSKGMKPKDVESWLRISFRTGQSEINELRNNPKYRFKKPQTSPYPVPVMDPVSNQSIKSKLLSIMEQKLKEAEQRGDKAAIRHYKRQINFINKRKDSDTGVLYETEEGYIGFKHTSNKKGFSDPVFNTSVSVRGEVMKKSINDVGDDYNLNQESRDKVEQNNDRIVSEAASDIERASKGPSGAVSENVDDPFQFTLINSVGVLLTNLNAGQTGRKNYLSEIRDLIDQDKKIGKKVNNYLVSRGYSPPYTDDQIAAAIFGLSKDGDTTTDVNKLVVKLSDNVALARQLFEDEKSKNPNKSDDEIKQIVAERINSYKTSDGQEFTAEMVQSCLSPEMDWIVDVGAQSREAMTIAHRKIVSNIQSEDSDWQESNKPNPPQPPKNGPHQQAYIQSYMKQMHWDRYIFGDEDDIGDMNIQGMSVNSQMIRGCLSDLSGYGGDINTAEGRKGLYTHLRENTRISSESQSLTFNSEKGGKPVEIGKENYRTKGVGNNALLGQFGKDLQSCLKKKASGT